MVKKTFRVTLGGFTLGRYEGRTGDEALEAYKKALGAEAVAELAALDPCWWWDLCVHPERHKQEG